MFRLCPDRGMTLVEVLVATLILALAVGGLVQGLIAIMETIDLARDQSQATTDLRSMLERIRATPFDFLTTQFPDSIVNGPVSSPYTGIVGTYMLRQENITVTYANATTDPLEINVALAWQDKRSRPRAASMATFRTR